MSVSNAFGSNTFNIFIALALPWMVGAVINGRDQPLTGCPAPAYMYRPRQPPRYYLCKY